MNPPSSNGNGNGRVRIPSVSVISVTIALLVQFAGGLIWLNNEHHARLELQRQVEQRIKDADGRLSQLDARLSRLDEFVRMLDGKQNVINTQNGARFDNIEGHFNRSDDRVDRVVAALDKTYSMLNEHMRDPKLHRQQ